MKSFILSITLILCISGISYAQSPSYVPTITPPAPDAAALMKFTDIPVSPYTGASSVSVPIYTIKAKGLSIPISVDYHTGGIRLEEEASSTGLGWALNAGGMITRTINDKDDLGGEYFGQPVPQPQGNLLAYQPANGQLPALDAAQDSALQINCPTCSFDYGCLSCPWAGNRYMFFFNCSYLINFKGHTVDFTNPFTLIGNNPFDMEPDTYSFNFLGKSGKFIILRDKITVVMEKQDNIKIQVLQPGSTAASIVFVITDDNGNKFYFNQTQSYHPSWQPSGTPTSWYLSKIVTQQNDLIIFTYAMAGVTTVASEAVESVDGPGGNAALVKQTNIGSTYDNVNIQTIDYADGQVQFFNSGGRTDLSGGIKLDSIRVYSKTTAGLKYLKSNKFYYTYFSPAASGISYSDVGDGPVELQRLKLDSVKEYSGGNALNPYSFAYNHVPWPYGEKHSYSIDHWGYYNAAGNSQLIPSESAYYSGFDPAVPPQQFTYNGANREPSTVNNTEVFSLHRVNYPTGGSSIFNYEANTYNSSNSTSPQLEFPQQVLAPEDTIINLNSNAFTHSTDTSSFIDFTKILHVIPQGIAGTNASITITFVSNYPSTGWPPADFNGYGHLYFIFNGGKTDLTNVQGSCSGPQCSITIPLTISNATQYPWTAHWDKSSTVPPADFSEIHVEVTFSELKTVALGNNPTLTAGGLRVQSIIDSTATGIAKERIWNYQYGSSGQYSNGILMSTPVYLRNEVRSTAGGGSAPVFTIFSSSSTSTTSAISGNIVGYSHVTETTINPSNSADNGKIVYSYTNTPDSVINYNSFRMPGIMNMGNNLNGSELSRITYKDSAGIYRKVAETDNFYHTANRGVYYSAKYRGSQDGNHLGLCPGGTPVANQGMAMFFPSIKSERVLLDSTRNIVYDQNDTTKLLVTTNKSFYDNPVHYLPTRSKFVDSKGTTHVSKVTYPQDYITAGNYTGNTILDSLIGRNMVAENIEKRDSIYYTGSSSGFVTSASESRYKQLSTGTMAMDKEYKLDIVNPVTDFVPMTISGNTYSHDGRYRQLISFDKYLANNIAQYTLLYQPPVSIIWDYKNVSPIAQIKGAGLTDVAYTSFEADSSGHWTISSAIRDSVTAALTGTKSYNLSNGAISKTSLTAATTYVVSYWTKNSSPLIITGTISGYPVSGATLNGWTYYEHQVTGQTTITLSGTGNIDELRLYPNNAEMTSYTYSPLTGVTSINDARGGINFYEYDGFQRLVNIKDQYGNIVKNYVYHYQGQ
jgi:hypothetical protein